MSLLWKERFKFFTLIFLITASLLQVGILWDYQDHGLPFNLLYRFSFNSAFPAFVNTDEDNYEDYFAPYRVIVSAGYDNPRWILDESSDDYKVLWGEARSYLKNALTSKPVQYIPLTEWGKLIANRSVILEFKTNIRAELMEWLYDIPNVSSQRPSGVYKMIISPEEDLNYNSNTVYIRDDAGIFKYTFTFAHGRMARTDFADLFTRLEDNKNLRQYSVLKEKYNIASIGQDILGVLLKGPKYSSYNIIKSSLPEELNVDRHYTSADVDRIADAILKEEKHGYDRSWDENNIVEFKTLNNIYRVHSDGFLEYKFLASSTGSDKGSVKDSFTRAAEFLVRINPDLTEPDVKLYLSGIEENSDSYRFTFDYTIGGLPVLFDFKTEAENGQHLDNAFVMEVNSMNVLKCYGVLRKFEKDRKSDEYNINFLDLMNDAYKKHGYSEFKNIKNISIESIDISYKVEYSNNNRQLEPVWIIRTTDRTYTIPMSRK